MLTLQEIDESFKVNNLRLKLVDDLLFYFGWVHYLTDRPVDSLTQLIRTAQLFKPPIQHAT